MQLVQLVNLSVIIAFCLLFYHETVRSILLFPILTCQVYHIAHYMLFTDNDKPDTYMSLQLQLVVSG